MTKPTLENARWATDESNNTAPSSGQRDTGWTPGQLAVSDYFNVLSFEAFQWFAFFDAIFGTDGSITLPTDEHLTLQGTGELKHGTRSLHLNVIEGITNGGTFSVGSNNTGAWTSSGAGDVLVIPLPVLTGWRLTSVRAPGCRDPGCRDR